MAERNPEFEANLLRQYENWGVYLHPSQTYLGRSYIALNREGLIDPFEVTLVEFEELDIIMSALKHTVNRLYRPDKYDYSNYGNTWQHCHWHVIPRYDTPRIAHGYEFIDPNPGRNYSPYPKIDLPADVFDQIKIEMSDELNRE